MSQDFNKPKPENPDNLPKDIQPNNESVIPPVLGDNLNPASLTPESSSDNETRPGIIDGLGSTVTRAAGIAHDTFLMAGENYGQYTKGLEFISTKIEHTVRGVGSAAIKGSGLVAKGVKGASGGIWQAAKASARGLEAGGKLAERAGKNTYKASSIILTGLNKVIAKYRLEGTQVKIDRLNMLATAYRVTANNYLAAGESGKASPQLKRIEQPTRAAQGRQSIYWHKLGIQPETDGLSTRQSARNIKKYQRIEGRQTKRVARQINNNIRRQDHNDNLRQTYGRANTPIGTPEYKATIAYETLPLGRRISHAKASYKYGRNMSGVSRGIKQLNRSATGTDIRSNIINYRIDRLSQRLDKYNQRLGIVLPPLPPSQELSSTVEVVRERMPTAKYEIANIAEDLKRQKENATRRGPTVEELVGAVVGRYPGYSEFFTPDSLENLDGEVGSVIIEERDKYNIERGMDPSTRLDDDVFKDLSKNTRRHVLKQRLGEDAPPEILNLLDMLLRAIAKEKGRIPKERASNPKKPK